MIIVLIRIYLALFQRNARFVFTQDEQDDERRMNIFAIMYSFVSYSFIFSVHIILIGLILERFRNLFYMTNFLVFFFGMLNKFLGYKTMWEKRNKLYLNFGLTIISLIVACYIINGIDEIKTKEIKYQEKQVLIIKMKQNSLSEIKQIVDSL